jgi:hypothetical protein
MDADRVQVSLTAGAGSIESVRTIRLSNATVTVDGDTLTPAGQVQVQRTTTSLMIHRSGPGAFTAEISVTDACGPYPLFFGGGS